MLKDEVLGIKEEDVPSLQESRLEDVESVIERRRATRADKKNKRDVDNKPEMNIRDSTCNTKQDRRNI